MLAVLCIAALVASTVADCDLSGVPEEQRALGQRVCRIEDQIQVLSRALQELLTRTDITIDEEPISTEKRKNEFIRFGKRSSTEKRKNEFIRFGKRKNEFIRFGRSDPSLQEDSMEKRKNEFIRFG